MDYIIIDPSGVPLLAAVVKQRPILTVVGNDAQPAQGAYNQLVVGS